MDNQANVCPACGTPIKPDGRFCSGCGAPVGQSPQAAPPVAAPNHAYGQAAPAFTYPQEMPAPTPPADAGPGPALPLGGTPAPGYGSPYPAQGYSAPQYTPPVAQHGVPTPPSYPPPPAPPAGYGGYTPQPPPPPKKRNTALVATLVITGIVLVIGSIVIWLIFGGAGGFSSTRQTYEELLDTICSGTTAREVVRHKGQLAEFDKRNTGAVDADLQALMDACEDYQDSSPNDEDTYLKAIETMEALKKSDIRKVSSCASNVLSSVKQDYDEYLSSITSSSFEPDSSLEPESSSSQHRPAELDPFGEEPPYEMSSDLAVVTDGSKYSFEFTNTGDAAIEYYEVWVFCFDENGQPLNEEIYEIEWEYDFIDLQPGAAHTAEFTFMYNNNVAYALPFVNYVELSDDSYWGITDYVADMEDVYWYMEEIQAAANRYMGEHMAGDEAGGE